MNRMRRVFRRLGRPSWPFVAVVGLVVAVGSVVQPAVLPIRSPTLSMIDYFNPVETARGEITGQLRELRLRSERARWIDSLAPLAVAGFARGEAVVYGWPDRIELDDVEAAGGEVDALVESRVGGQDVAVGVFAVTSIATGDDHAIMGEVEGRSYCIKVEARGRSDSPRSLRSFPTRGYGGDGGVGACYWPLMYGAPGDRIAEWYDLRGHVGGRSRSGNAFFADDLQVRVMLFDDVPYRSSFVRRACAAGHDGSCASIWTTRGSRTAARTADPTTDNDLAAVVLGNGSSFSWQDSPLPNASVLVELERAFGGEAFARFWTSDAPVEQAFEEAFGGNATEWVRTTTLRSNPALQTFRAGPSPLRSGGVGLLVASLLGLLVGMRYADRRTVG